MTTTTFDLESIALIEEHVRRLLAMMDFEAASVHCRLQSRSGEESEAQEQLCITIEAGDDGKRLIGVQGTHLDALQHLVRSVLRRQLDPGLHIALDVNGYRARRERSLLQLAESAARRAHHTGRTIVLKPMAAADRRVLHTALATRGDVSTESMGDEPNRRVVVRPVFL
jgi:spoIIIJ-associated protein